MSLSDYEQIQNAKAKYCAAADRSCEDRAGAHQAMKALFTDDVAADYGFGPMEGGDTIAGFLSDKIAGGSLWMVHNIHSPLIEIDGDTASAKWTVNVRMKRPGKDTVDFVFGRYSDEFRKVGGEWKIAKVGFDRYE